MSYYSKLYKFLITATLRSPSKVNEPEIFGKVQEQLQEMVVQLHSCEQSITQLQAGLSTEKQKSSTLVVKCKTWHSALITEQHINQLLTSRCQSLETKCESLNAALISEQQKIKSLEARCESLESSVPGAAERKKLNCLEAKCNSQEERLKTMEDTVERLWAIPRDEINLSSNILGTGGWGYVKEATFRGRQVAAKCLHEEIISPHNQQRFTKEMKISARCRHKNLVEFIGAVPDHPAIIVIEMMDCTLRFALGNGRIIPNHIHPICIDVAEGLVYLHSLQLHPLIHRDVSAPNVLLKAVGTGWIAKLCDLGSAQFANIVQTLGPGCVLYAAPEVRQSDTVLKQTEKVDVYSYGVLLIEILTREMPAGTISQLITFLIPIWPQFVSIIQRCTNADPTKRPTMKEVINLLNKTAV